MTGMVTIQTLTGSHVKKLGYLLLLCGEFFSRTKLQQESGCALTLGADNYHDLHYKP